MSMRPVRRGPVGSTAQRVPQYVLGNTQEVGVDRMGYASVHVAPFRSFHVPLQLPKYRQHDDLTHEEVFWPVMKEACDAELMFAYAWHRANDRTGNRIYAVLDALDAV